VRERVRPEAPPLLVQQRQAEAEHEDRQPGRDLVREREQGAGQHGGVGEPHPLAEQAEQDDAEEQLLDHAHDARTEDEVDDEPGQRAVRGGRDDERLRVRPDDRGLRVRDDDRQPPQRDTSGDGQPRSDRGGETEVDWVELRPGSQQQDQSQPQRDVLRDGEDRDLLGRQLVEMADRDREEASGNQDRDVREEEREDRAEEDRPEAPTRGGRVGRRDLYRSPVRRARSAASSTTSLQSDASGLGLRVKTPISATSSGIS